MRKFVCIVLDIYCVILVLIDTLLKNVNKMTTRPSNKACVDKFCRVCGDKAIGILKLVTNCVEYSYVEFRQEFRCHHL